MCKRSFLKLLIHANHAAKAIIKYRADQTGAKTQSGGLTDGDNIPEYQGSL